MAFPWMKNSVFWFVFFFLRFFLMVQSQMGQHWFRYWLGAEIKYSYVIFISGPPTSLPANPPVIPTFPWWKNPARHRSPHVTSFWCVMVRRELTKRERWTHSHGWVIWTFVGVMTWYCILHTRRLLIRHISCCWCLLGATMTLWHGNVCRITGPLWGESTDHRWVLLTNGQRCVAIRVFFVVSLNRLNSRQDAIKFRPHGAHVTSL